MTSSDFAILPSDLGLSADHFPVWRSEQVRMITTTDAKAGDYRSHWHSMPTGTGKSLAYVGYALLSGKRTLILTGTKALQDQLMRDFGDVAVQIKGKVNYTCPVYDNCEDGAAGNCRYKQTDTCERTAACNAAKRARVVISNYAWWCVADRTKDVGAFDLLVLDEAHNAADWVVASMEILITWQDMAVLKVKQADLADPDKAVEFAREVSQRVSAMVEAAKAAGREGNLEAIRHHRHMLELEQKIQNIVSFVSSQSWVRDKTDEGVLLSPMWAAPYVEQKLFRGIGQIIGLSATLTPYAITNMLGLSMADIHYQEYLSPFPVAQSAVYWNPTVPVKRGMPYGDSLIWVSRMDAYLDQWAAGYKGVIHPHSYDYAQQITELSRHSKVFITPTRPGGRRGDKDEQVRPLSNRDAIDTFLALPPPAVLVSPAVKEGYDFAGDACRIQLIAKVPFPDQSGLIMQARTKADPAYYAHITSQALVQMTGRGNRYLGDWCMNVILDDNIRWFIAKWKQMFPQFWLNQYQRNDKILGPDAYRRLVQGSRVMADLTPPTARHRQGHARARVPIPAPPAPAPCWDGQSGYDPDDDIPF